MDVEPNKGEKLAYKINLNQRSEDGDTFDRGLFLPLVKNETKQERAHRILAMMEESNDRLNRMLEIFNRMDR